MDELLKARFHSEQIALAKEIGEREGSLKEKIRRLLDEFPDPLLSLDEIRDLLQTGERKVTYKAAVDELVEEGTI